MGYRPGNREAAGRTVIQCFICEEPPNGVPFSIPSSKAQGLQSLHILRDATMAILAGDPSALQRTPPAGTRTRTSAHVQRQLERRAHTGQLGAITHEPPDLDASTPQASQQHDSQEGKPPALGSRASLREALLVSDTVGTASAGAWSPPGARPNQPPRKHLIVVIQPSLGPSSCYSAEVLKMVNV